MAIKHRGKEHCTEELMKMDEGDYMRHEQEMEVEAEAEVSSLPLEQDPEGKV